MIGYLLEREIASIAPEIAVATLLTQVEVDPDDPAFARPGKPIGPRLSEAEAKQLSERLGWRFRCDPSVRRGVENSSGGFGRACRYRFQRALQE